MVKTRPSDGSMRRSRMGIGSWLPPTRLLGIAMVMAWLGVVWHGMVRADELAPPGDHVEPPEAQQRILYVPFDALHGVLGGVNERVFLTREEYEQLEAEARRRPPTEAPQGWVLLSAQYDGVLRDSVAVVRGVLEVEILQPGLQAVPLPLAGLELRTAALDGVPARLARDPQGQVVLLLREVGRHRLELECHAPVTISAAEQSLQLQLPATGSSRLMLAVPGNVEVKSGVAVVDRQYDAAADQTRFELLFHDPAIAVVMSLNNRRLREDRVALARSVQVAELTTAYERLHATVEMHVIHGTADRFIFEVPAGFQVTSVTSPRMSQWVLRSDAGSEALEVTLREAARGSELLSITATRTPVVIGAWSMPFFVPRDVAGHVAVVGLLAEARLRPLSVSSVGLIRIDTSVLRSALPPSVFEAEPGAPAIRPIAACYAPGTAIAFSAHLEDPRDELRAVTHLRLSLEESQQTLRGGFTLTPQAAQQTSFAFRMPRSWQVQQLHTSDATALVYHPFPTDADTRYVVTLPQAVDPGQSVTVLFDATSRSASWLGDWASQDIEFPRVVVEQAIQTAGVIALEPIGDLTAQPVTLEGLSVLDAQERARFGLADTASELTYQVTADPYRAVFRIERTQPRIAARNYSLFQIREGLLIAHYEAAFTIQRARAHRLQLELPATTPTMLSIRGLHGTELKEFSRDTRDDRHIWTVLLAAGQLGTVTLAIDFEQSLETSSDSDISLPLIRAVGVDYQTQMVSVEGDPALDIDLQTTMRRVDVGEMAEAQTMPGRRLLGAFASTVDGEELRARIARRDLHPVPATIVQRAELVSVLSTAGVCQSAARYRLQTKLPYLTLELPAGAELWSVSLNGQPVKPRRRGGQIVLSLQAEQANIQRDLQVVYETPVAGVSWIGQVRTQAPLLRIAQDENDAGVPVPQVDLVWHVHLPTGFALSRVDGTVFTRDLKPVANPWRTLAHAGAVVGGGMHGPSLVTPWKAVLARSEWRPASAIGVAGSEEARAVERGPLAAKDSLASSGVDAFSDSAALGEGQISNEDLSHYGLQGMPGMAPGAGGMPGQPPPTMFGAGMESGMPVMPGAGGMMGGAAGYPGMPGAGPAAGGMGGMVMGQAGTPAGGWAGEPMTQNGAVPAAAPAPQGRAAGVAEMPAPPAEMGVTAVAPADAESAGVVSSAWALPESSMSNLSSAQEAPQLAKYWALQGLRGLSIELDASPGAATATTSSAPAPGPLTFVSLGTDPELDITIYDRNRMSWLAAGIVLLIFVLGLLQARAPVASRVKWVVPLALVACGLPIVGGPVTEFEIVFQHAMLAIFALIPLWIVIAWIERVAGWRPRLRKRRAAASGTAILLLACAGLALLPATANADDLLDLLKPLLDQDQALTIPDDAVVIPYDPADLEGRTGATSVLVPYARYVELWNAAHPEQKIGEPSGTHPFALAGARYDVTLDDGEHILLQGVLDVELYTNQPVEIPLALTQGVITAALWDGQPARLRAVQPAAAVDGPQDASTAAQRPGGESAIPSSAAELPPALLTLVAEGQGSHRLELTVRVAVSRQGGWRQAAASIPYAEATSLSARVPQAGSTVRRRMGSVIVSETTTEPDQTISATLHEKGAFDLSWREPFTAGTVDQALTATSRSVVDVREDGVRVAWHIDFAFGQTDRSLFRLDVPPDYLVERIDGPNVRGWDLMTEADRRLVHVELLKAARQSEQLTVYLSRSIAFPPGETTRLEVPQVAAPDAALQRGTIQIRRSPILELQTSDERGISRTDSDPSAEQLMPAEEATRSPLGIREYQAYRFSTVPFTITLAVSHVPVQASAELRTLFRIGETAAAVESEIRLQVRDRALFQVRVGMPDDLELDQVTAAGLSDWSIATVDDQRTLTAFFPAGQTGEFSLALGGKLRGHQPTDEIPLPRLVVRDVARQQGTLVVQADVSLEVRPDGLEHMGPVLLDRVTSWLADEQRPLARLAFEYEGADYGGKIVIQPRAPRVTCVSVTNVRVTYREIQETVLLDFQIAEAGVRNISFRLPASLQNASIAAPRLRRQRVEPIDGESDVRVTLELQDAVTGDYRVVVQQDRAILSGRQIAPLPLAETGTTTLRYVTLENAGRDELVPDGSAGMEPVSRPSRQWDQLATRLGGGEFADAYVAAEMGPEVEFGYQLKQREMVRTAGARIGWARTELVLDASGAYRAALSLSVDNRTEPYLEIALPPGAALWTAHVASEGVKPAQASGPSDAGVLRIPLIKTAEGDLDYPVVLRYAGKLDRVRTLRTVEIPFIRTVNIQPELSQVKLYLPEEFRWVQFEGTATRVAGEEDFQAGYVAYRTQQVENLTQIIRGANTFSKSRAFHNMLVLGKELEGLQREGRQAKAVQLRENLESNARVLQTATEEIEKQAEQVVETLDNRGRLQMYFSEQGNTISRNEAIRLNMNFSPSAVIEGSATAGARVELFDEQWFESARQRQDPTDQAADRDGDQRLSEAREGMPARRRLQEEASVRAGPSTDAPTSESAAQQVFQAAPALATDESAQRSDLARGLSRKADTDAELGRAYVDKIEQQVAQQEAEFEGRNLPGRGDDTGTIVLDGTSGTVTWGDFAARGGLASLDFELPRRGIEFYFTTPRGTVNLSARPVSSRILARWGSLLRLLTVVVAGLVGWWLLARLSLSRWRRLAAGVILCLAGLLMLLAGTLPLFGLALLLGGTLLIVPKK